MVIKKKKETTQDINKLIYTYTYYYCSNPTTLINGCEISIDISQWPSFITGFD